MGVITGSVRGREIGWLRRLASRAREEHRLRDRLGEAEQEIRTLRAQLAAERHTRIELQVAHADLLAHDRASVLADWRGEPRPTRYSEGHLEHLGLLPSRDSTPEQVVSQGLVLSVRMGGDHR